MSLSSLILWKSSWLVSSIPSIYSSHGVGVLVGVLVCLAAFAWSCASPRSLRLFLERVYPPVMVLALLYSYLPGSAVFLPLNLLVGYAIPVAGTYLFIFAWFFLVAAQDMENGFSASFSPGCSPSCSAHSSSSSTGVRRSSPSRRCSSA